uniref:Somatomedin B and thrombospondin type 1 domain containing n=1 Tax=Tetraodon nigroviridis TaxID=99883 RepID=H3CRX7_TETNG
LTCLLLTVCTLSKSLLVSGGCLGRCCQGRDLDCFTTDWRMDRVYGTCYCDQACLQTKDCCFDYFTECPARNCIVSEWSFWSGCAGTCTTSFRARVREVAQRPSHSGAPCPSLEQRSGCRVYTDFWGRNCEHSSGPAVITSMAFGKARPKHDHYGNPLNPGFCMEFTVESRTSHCSLVNQPHTRWMRYITEGFVVCVACEPPAMPNEGGSCRGDGRESDQDTLLHWQAAVNHQCSGTWRKIRKTRQCNCPPQHSFVFI